MLCQTRLSREMHDEFPYINRVLVNQSDGWFRVTIQADPQTHVDLTEASRIVDQALKPVGRYAVEVEYRTQHRMVCLFADRRSQ